MTFLASTTIFTTLGQVFSDLFKFSQAIQYVLDNRGVFLHPQSFDEDSLIIFHALLANPTIEEDSIIKACRLAALLYLKSLTRGMDHLARTSKLLADKLKAASEGIVPTLIPIPLLLWIFYIGGVATKSTPEQTWFKQKLENLFVREPELRDVEGAKAMLEQLLWVDFVHEAPLRGLWASCGRGSGNG